MLCDSVDWIQLAQDRVLCRVLMNSVMNIQLPKKVVISLPVDCKPVREDSALESII
jgi:hypothetical protein